MNCDICERGCVIPEGSTGACGMYVKKEQKIVELYPNKYLIVCPISIETMPVLHFYPGGKFLQISTVGCNFDCNGCISTVIVKEMDPTGGVLRELSPEQVVDEAVKNNCIGITFLMNDPLASFPTFIKVAKAAKKQDLLVGCSSNAYFTETSLDKIINYLDFINVGFKGLSNQAYRNCGGSTPEPVLRNIKKLHENGVHVEISCIHYNNNQEEVLSLARQVAGISRDIPLQIMRFIPVEGADQSLEASIRNTEKLHESLRKYLNHIYIFNSPGTKYLNTFCPSCGKTVYKRNFYGPMGAKLKSLNSGSEKNGICPQCGYELNIKGTLAKTAYQEGDFQGGYPFTRALEMMEAILIAMGAKNKKKVVQIWEEILGNENGGLQKLHRDLQSPKAHIGLIRYFGKLAQMEDQAEELAGYMEEKISFIQDGLAAVKKKPRVYYAMGKPNFCIKGGRLENQLVEAAGGISVNKEIEGDGRPGMEISLDELEALNPDIIFISSFIGSPVEDFYHFCQEAGLNVEAVRCKRIYTHPSPCWDFGSPRWILGLMNMANVFHPDIYHFDMPNEAKMFYRRFYDMDFNLSDFNRSFGKPSSKWKWGN